MPQKTVPQASAPEMQHSSAPDSEQKTEPESERKRTCQASVRGARGTQAAQVVRVVRVAQAGSETPATHYRHLDPGKALPEPQIVDWMNQP